MKIGIIGLPNAGKTTVFNALTRNNIATASYASESREHHLGQVYVPDPRFDELVRMYNPKKQAPASIEFVDVAGITRGAGGEGGLSQEMIGFIRDVDALIHVVRVFEDQAVPHVEDSIDPRRDIGTVDTEMILNDLLAVEKRLERLEREVLRLPKEKRQVLNAEKEVLEGFRTHLEDEKSLRSLTIGAEEEKLIRGYAFLSLKPIMILLNIGEGQIKGGEEITLRYAPGPDVPTIAACGEIEAEISQLDDEDGKLFMSDLGISESSLDRIIRTSYDLLGLESFFTVGSDEVRAWTIHRGDDAVTAAGKIHSDMARGFIRAEVVAYDDLMTAGSWSKAKEMGKFRLEGKQYRVKDGDILSIRFNV